MGNLAIEFKVNTLRPRQNFADNIFKSVFLNENVWILLKISLKFVPKVWIHNITALVQIMAWCQPGDKPLSELMMVNLLMHICTTWPQWIKQKLPPLSIKPKIGQNVKICGNFEVGNLVAPWQYLVGLGNQIYGVVKPCFGFIAAHMISEDHILWCCAI